MGEGRESEKEFGAGGSELPPDFPDVPIDKWEQGDVRVFDGENSEGERVCMVQYFDEEGSVARYNVFVKKGDTWRLDEFSREVDDAPRVEAATLREITQLLRDELGTARKREEREDEIQ